MVILVSIIALVIILTAIYIARYLGDYLGLYVADRLVAIRSNLFKIDSNYYINKIKNEENLVILKGFKLKYDTLMLGFPVQLNFKFFKISNNNKNSILCSSNSSFDYIIFSDLNTFIQCFYKDLEYNKSTIDLTNIKEEIDSKILNFSETNDDNLDSECLNKAVEELRRDLKLIINL